MHEGDDAALDSATQLVVLGRTISRSVDDNSEVILAILLSLAGRSTKRSRQQGNGSILK